MTNSTIADVIIIGGGVIGASIAYHLATLGVSDVIVLEKESLGSGSTSKAPGGIRQQFGREIELRFAVESMKFWKTFEEQTGQPLQFRRVGYLYLLTTQAEVEDFQKRIALQQQFGIPTRMLAPEEISKLVPSIALEGVLAGSYCHTDGRTSPADATYGYVQAARRKGVQFIEGTEVLDICTSKGKVTGVRTSVSEFSAPNVINAAGPEARSVAAWAGIDLPVYPERLHVVVTGPVKDLPKPIPCIMEPSTTLYMASEGEGVLLTLKRHEESAGSTTKVDRDFIPEIANAGARRIPEVINTYLQTAWAGLLELTPDKLPVLCRVERPEGFILANGLSGHGVMFSPAVGKVVSELVVDGYSSTIDISELGLDRFP